MARINLKNDAIFIKLLKMGHFKVYDDGTIINTKTGKQLGIKPNSRGYGVVCHKVNGRIRNIQAHRLIWIALKGPITDVEIQVNHEDGNKLNNNPSNHILTDGSGNMKHAVRIGLYAIQKGADNANAKLSNKDVAYIRSNYGKNGILMKDLAEMFNVDRTTISYVVNHKTYKVVKKPWRIYLANRK